MTFRPPQVALITGAAGGLGNGLVKALVSKGWKVFAHVHRRASGEPLEQLGATVIEADLGSVRDTRGLISHLGSLTDRLDAIINNAGVGYGPPGAERQLSIDGIELRLAVNALAPTIIMDESRPLLRPGCQILNVASTNQALHDPTDINLVHAWSGENAYRQSKAFLLILTDVFARLYQHQGVLVNAIHPGSRLPTKIVMESGVKPTGCLQSGIRFVEDTLDGAKGSGNFFVFQKTSPVPVSKLYPNEHLNRKILSDIRNLAKGVMDR